MSAPSTGTAHDDWPSNYTSGAAWWAVFVTMIFQISSLIDRQIVSILIPEMRADLGLNTFQIFTLQGLAFALFYGAMGLLIGGWVDRYSRQKIMFAGIVIWSVAAAGTGLARSYMQLFAARLMVGFGEGAISPASQSLISNIFPRHRMSTPMSCFTVAGVAGASLSFALGGYLLDLFTRSPMIFLDSLAPWRQVLIVTGLPGVLIAFLAFTIRTPAREPVTADQASWASFFRFLNQNLRLMGGIVLGLGLLAMLTQAALVSAATYARDVIGISASEAGQNLSIAVAIGGIGGGILAGLSMDYFFKRGIRDAVFRALSVVVLFIAPLLAWVFTHTDADALFIVLTLLMATLGAAHGPGLAAMQMVSPSQLRGRFAALAVFSSNLFGFAFGPMMVGAITDYGYGDSQQIGTAVAITVLVLTPLITVVFWSIRKPFLTRLDSI